LLADNLHPALKSTPRWLDPPERAAKIEGHAGEVAATSSWHGREAAMPRDRANVPQIAGQ
jgi:hypothetical protein